MADRQVKCSCGAMMAAHEVPCDIIEMSQHIMTCKACGGVWIMYGGDTSSEYDLGPIPDRTSETPKTSG